PMASCEAPLKPNQPSQRMNVPSVASGMDEPGSGWTAPSGPYLPLRAPSTSAPASAAQPPTEWTMVEPAKSEKPMASSQPWPHFHDPVTGYMKPVRMTVKSRNGHSLMRSASVPETMEAAVATKTIWKNQSEATEESPSLAVPEAGQP